MTGLDEDANQGACSFKARLQILGVIREDVGTGKDYKQAATDAFKRAAVRFGIAHELYAYEQNWVLMDGDGKYAKPLEDPAVAYTRRHGRALIASSAASPNADDAAEEGTSDDRIDAAGDSSVGGLTSDERSYPKCGGRTWDNRLTKRNPKAPDYKRRDRSCVGVIWSAKSGKPQADEAEEIPF